MTCLAIGAATLPPDPPFSTSTTTATVGFSAGAKPANQACDVLSATSAVPVLPATWTPLSAAAVPVPPFTTSIIRSRMVAAVAAVIGLSHNPGEVLSTKAPL